MKYRKILLTNFKETLVSKEDYERLFKYRWNSDKRNYVYRETKKGNKYHRILMHRDILNNYDKGMVTDHIDGDPLNNTRENLRICTQKENTRNSKAIKKTSIYKGVHLSKRYNKKSYITYIADGKFVRQITGIGNEKIAALIYDILAYDRFGEYARFNYPDLIEKIKDILQN